VGTVVTMLPPRSNGMSRAATTLLVCAALAGAVRMIGANQPNANVAGKWNVTIRTPGHLVTEQWTVEQKGTIVTGIAKGEKGEMPVSGTIEGAFFRVSEKDGDKQYKVRATVDGNAMDGSITMGVGDAHLWFAKRAPTGGK
jgi:hypothetical protein